jgi:oxygen-independent coproporphyrinogen III oxidase
VYLYLHVPFCARRCSYCDFAIAVRRRTPDQEYLDAVRFEWEVRRSDVAWDASPEVATIYFGGGTPSRLRGETLAEIIAMVRRDRSVAEDAEITIEVNPDDVSLGRAERWRAAGINRISLGVQSHDPAVLEWMHRTHTADQVPPAIAALRQAGFTNISMDLIFGLPMALGRDLTRDLAATFALEPTHLSLYGLTIEPHTPLARWTSRGEATAIPDERYAMEYLEVHQALVAHGFEHYEVSNAGLPGFRAVHNSAYWQGVDYLGLGPSAHSLLSGVRSWNVRE